jgi:hypothetical protein
MFTREVKFGKTVPRCVIVTFAMTSLESIHRCFRRRIPSKQKTFRYLKGFMSDGRLVNIPSLEK